MKTCLNILLLLLLHATMMQAQRVSRDYRDRPMTEVLSDLASASRQRIVFIHDELHDFTVTQQFDSLTIAEAIRTCIGFYPISLNSQGDSILLVKCTQNARHRLIGRLTDERGIPVSYANITLRSTADSTIINKGVSNQNGRFVIPTDASEVLVHISHVAYQPVSSRYKTGDIGTIRLLTALEQLGSVSITAKQGNRAEAEYQQLALQVGAMVWNMPLPQFRVDTLPVKYRDAPAVVLADYDSIYYYRYRQARRLPFSKENSRWLQTIHLHRIRYYVNSQEAARQLSKIAFSTRTDITNYVMYKLTVMGIRIIKPDGRQRTVDTFPYFKPQIHPLKPASDTDTISIEGLEQGDILDVFTFHRFKEPLSPYRFQFPASYPTLSYEARAVTDKLTVLEYDEDDAVPIAAQVLNSGERHALSYHLADYDPRPRSSQSTTLLHARLAEGADVSRIMKPKRKTKH